MIENILSLDTGWSYIHTKILNRMIISADERDFYKNREKAIKEATRSLLEAFAEEVIPWKVNVGNSYRFEGWNECSELARLKAKGIIEEVGK